MSSFGTYIIGILVLTAGLALAAWLLGAPPIWIVVGAVVVLGVGIMSATSKTKPRDPPTT